MSGSLGPAIVFFLIVPVILGGVLKPLGLVAPEKYMSYVYAVWGLLAVAITFAKPSRYALTGYSRKDVNRVLERIPDLNSCTKETLPALQSCLQRAEEDTKARLTTIKWAAGTVFALALYIGQKGFDLKDGNLISSALFPLTIAAFIAVLIAFHARGTIAVYGLAYAIIHQLQSQLDMRPKKIGVRTRWLVRQPSILVTRINAGENQWTK